MHYKTMILEMLQQRTELHEQLRANRTLLPTLESLASELKARHEAWKANLSQATPGSDPIQIVSEALELALHEIENRLPCESNPDGSEALSLDNAMAFIRRHTSVE